ncbi:unnamed protein product [Symbiodinium natans]|uniref:Uncharacterized protein n=1 Tax=Symbiodinium natans TaxID=878477 RepID=A0A812PYG6_9DINO|nr:unnamed protein product [Symbiodinium natans]
MSAETCRTTFVKSEKRRLRPAWCDANVHFCAMLKCLTWKLSIFLIHLLSYGLPAAAEPLQLRDVQKFLDPVFVPDFFFDATTAAEVLGALVNNPPLGQGYVASVLDAHLPLSPRMAPMLVWETGLLLKHLTSSEVSQVIVDVGAHEWSRFLPILREDAQAWLVLLEPSRKAFLTLYRRLKMDYTDVIDRVVALPMALTWEPGHLWGFRVLHTNDYLDGECNSLLEPDDQIQHPCVDKGSEEVVPVMSLDVLLQLLIHDVSLSEASHDAVRTARSKGPPISVKLDAQGADLSILAVLESAEELLESVYEVQLEVSAQIYRGQPSRRDVLVGMSRLGFQLDWNKKEIHDGGVHKIRSGCRLVTEHPRTEDCFFIRSSHWAHGRIVDLFLRRPIETLRINEGTHMSISSQYSYHMRHHIDMCLLDDGDGELEDQDEVTGAGALACFFRIAGWPLRHAALSTATLWEMIWHSKQGARYETILIAYAQVFVTMWDLLMSGGQENAFAWDDLHDAGVAHLMFMVLVEASCLAFPHLCSSECRDDGTRSEDSTEQPDAGGTSPCTTLSDCWMIFRSANPKAVLKHPDVYVPVLRRAQRLTAPSCFPSTWHLELDRSAALDPAAPFPTVDTGGHNVTAIAVDSSRCSLEITVIAWDMDAAGMVEFHRAIWEEAERGRENIDAADFRIPTAGTLWDFDCRFDMPSGTVQTHGDVVSYSFLSELPGAVDAPVLSVRCEAPQVPKIAEAELMAPPSSVLLTRSVRALPEMPSLRLRVPLREARRPRIRTALCNSQVWGAQSLQELAPNLMEFWLLYYSEHLGIDEIYLYDLDGSFGSVPLVQELRASGRVVYEPSFSSIPPFKDLFELEGYKTATTHLVQTLVQHHCWQQARQNADWVISLNHGWDMFLFSPAGQTLEDLLQDLEPDQVTSVLGVRYGDLDEFDAKVRPSGNTFIRFPYHNDPEIRPEKHRSAEEIVVIAKPSLIDGVALSAVVVRPEAPLFSNLLEHPLPCPKGQSREFAGPMMHKAQWLDAGKWRANHYVQALGGRKVLYRAEEPMVALRNFSTFDAAAVQLGSELQERWKHRW